MFFGLAKWLAHPTSINDYDRHGRMIHKNMPSCVSSVRVALTTIHRSLYSDPRHNVVIANLDATEIDDSIGMGLEDAAYSGSAGPHLVLYANINNVNAIVANLPPDVRERALRSAFNRVVTRFMPSGQLPMWPEELIRRPLIGFPEPHYLSTSNTVKCKVGIYRVPCVTLVILYQKESGKLDFNNTSIRFTMIYPPHRIGATGSSPS